MEKYNFLIKRKQLKKMKINDNILENINNQNKNLNAEFKNINHDLTFKINMLNYFHDCAKNSDYLFKQSK